MFTNSMYSNYFYKFTIICSAKEITIYIYIYIGGPNWSNRRLRIDYTFKANMSCISVIPRREISA